jgi:hypothetical protein
MEAIMNLDIRDRRTQIGLGLVALGLLALLGDLGLFAGIGRLFGLLLFGAAGLIVLRMYRDAPSRIWTLPVGFGLLGLAIASLDVPWGGGAFLGAIGLGFLAVWLTDTDRERWWALIPAGVLLTLGVVAIYDEWLGGRGDVGGTLFFLGLAATFAALYLLPSVRQSWAIWPALGLGIVALLTVSFQGGWIVPIALIALGGWLLTRQSRPTDVRPSPPTSAPPPPAQRRDVPTSGEAASSEAAPTESAPPAEEAASSEAAPSADEPAPSEPAPPADEAAPSEAAPSGAAPEAPAGEGEAPERPAEGDAEREDGEGEEEDPDARRSF